MRIIWLFEYFSEYDDKNTAISKSFYKRKQISNKRILLCRALLFNGFVMYQNLDFLDHYHNIHLYTCSEFVLFYIFNLSCTFEIEMADSTISDSWTHFFEKMTILFRIYECNSNCSCSSRCYNRVVQNGIQLRLQVFMTENRGWGLRCIDDIPKGKLVFCVLWFYVVSYLGSGFHHTVGFLLITQKL